MTLFVLIIWGHYYVSILRRSVFDLSGLFLSCSTMSWARQVRGLFAQKNCTLSNKIWAGLCNSDSLPHNDLHLRSENPLHEITQTSKPAFQLSHLSPIFSNCQIEENSIGKDTGNILIMQLPFDSKASCSLSMQAIWLWHPGFAIGW